MFTTDSRTESFLSQIGAQFRYTNDLHLSELPCGWDCSNDARPVAKRESAIFDYASLMEAGSAAPAVIVHYKDTKIAVLDGIQRLAAAILAGFTRFSAYVVTSDSPDLLLAIRVLSNARLQGHAENPEWTKRNAVMRLVIDRGMGVTEVARLGGWRQADIERLVTVLRWGFEIRCIGGPTKLPDGIVRRIAEVTTQENLRASAKPIGEFLNLLNNGRFSTDDAIPYIDEFFAPITKQSTAIATYQERLSDFLEEPEVDVRLHGRSSPGLSADVNLRRAMRTCIGILDGIINDGVVLRYADEFFKLVKQIESRVRSLAPHCPQPVTTKTPADKWADK